MSPTRVFSAWDLIGFDGTTEVIDRNLGGDPNYAEPEYEPRPAMVRLAGGRSLYESVGNDGGRKVRLARLDPTPNGELHAAVRYVEPETELEVVEELAPEPDVVVRAVADGLRSVGIDVERDEVKRLVQAFLGEWREFRRPNVCVTAAEAAWFEEAARILRGGSAVRAVRFKAAVYCAKLARDARRAQ